ncbi:Fsf1p [Sugiyamaella lignohabitans]|uniref:Sidoreflexin n=1 Tax=Sugiyamaella lignohabitans TaxID=796027 RepID=A0A167CPL6_9ASCO|nr:Fsf1p [Sugiyamaella lignohabitans]ANB11956.1 Fsf1p [Sugiyamaella lignohabitans]
MASSVPGNRPLPESRYDLSTYMGRVRHCAEVSDPRMLFNTSKDIELARKLIGDYKNSDGPMTPELWRAKRVLDSTLHPDTGLPVVLPFRMSSYVLSNLVVTVGMLTPGLGTAGTLFWQIANQSLNVAVNTANANKSHPLSTQQLITNYLLAVSGSCSVALGLNAIVPRLKNVSASTKTILSRLVPFAAVVSAGIVNVFLMRGEEIRKGITVHDPETNEPVGTSKTAAKYAVGETALSRVITATPIMVFPPLILYRLQRGILRGKSNLAVTAANLGLITITSFAVLPFALGVFPTKRVKSTTQLEPELSNLKNSKGTPVSEVWFNRGM